MRTNLLIVESPTKARRLSAVLRPESGWMVAATYGDLMDLPSRKLGVRIARGKLELNWRKTLKGRKQLMRLRTVARNARRSGGQIYIGTAPDREGEILADHVMRSLQLPERTTPRVLLYSLAPDAVKRAIASPGRLDSGIVTAQEARRGLDRAVGDRLAKRLRRPISRLQAPVLNACAEQLAARRNFRPSTLYRAGFMVNQTFFSLPAQPMSWECEALRIARSAPARRVVSRKEEQKFVAPPAPCTTTDVLKAFADEACVQTITAALQKLFVEGLITYPKTDSRALDRGWVERARAQLGSNGGKQPPPGGWASLEKTTEKEAIRPTTTGRNAPASIQEGDPLNRRIYEYIAWRAFAACAISAREISVTLVLDNLATSTLTREDHAGWREYDPDRLHDASGVSDPAVWSLKENDPVRAVPSVEYLQSPYPDAPTVAWLVDWMEKKGVGKPSTYAPCLRKLIDRKLVTQHRSDGLVPTQMGLGVLNTLSVGAKDILRPEYAKALEKWLDDIAREESGPEEGAKLVLAGVRLASGSDQSSIGVEYQ